MLQFIKKELVIFTTIIVLIFVGYLQATAWIAERRLKKAQEQVRTIRAETQNKAKKIVSTKAEEKIKRIQDENYGNIDIVTSGYISY